jgi:hypothetical protein
MGCAQGLEAVYLVVLLLDASTTCLLARASLLLSSHVVAGKSRVKSTVLMNLGGD